MFLKATLKVFSQQVKYDHQSMFYIFKLSF